MTSFRTGFKIFGELSLKQGLGRIRSFSEDRKPGKWLPEDQWAVRQPGTTCPDPCTPKKPVKPSKSWLCLCKDAPPEPLKCDIRHNNCPPPPSKSDGPWYSLDNLIPKKKVEKPPPLKSCREEMKRKELAGECDEVCDKPFPLHIPPEDCTSKREPCPAPVVTLSCPLPKELDIMLWCGRPSVDRSRIAQKCQSDKLPYQEFRPQKTWKPPPFCLPRKGEPLPSRGRASPTGPIPYSEFKQLEVPKPLYTRYKSVELCDDSFMLCMIDATCPDNSETESTLAITPPSSPISFCCNPDLPNETEQTCNNDCEKRTIVAGSCRPVRIKKATTYAFRPKPTKLIERRIYKNPCANHKTCNFPFSPQENEENVENDDEPITPSTCGPPKTFTGTLTNEPQCYERDLPLDNCPPKWMFAFCKKGSKDSPLLPSLNEYPSEPDCSDETDGLKFYDNNNEGIHPQPPPDPCEKVKTEIVQEVEPPPPEPEVCPIPEFRNRFVLMPEHFNIKYMRVEKETDDDASSSNVEKFLEAKAVPSKKSSKSFPPMKENILYDLQRMCPNSSFDPTKACNTCRTPPVPECPRPHNFYRRFSTFTRLPFLNLRTEQLNKIQKRQECGDSSGKCKLRPPPKPKPCPEPKKASIYETTKTWNTCGRSHSLNSTLKSFDSVPSPDVIPTYSGKVILDSKAPISRKKQQFNESAHLKNAKKDKILSPYKCDTRDYASEIKNGITIKIDENILPNCVCTEHNDETTKAFIGSFGSWFNELFHAPPKKSTGSSKLGGITNKSDKTKEDLEHSKYIEFLKERCKKKLKSETTIQFSAGDKAFEITFEPKAEKKNKKKYQSHAEDVSRESARNFLNAIPAEEEFDVNKTQRKNAKERGKIGKSYKLNSGIEKKDIYLEVCGSRNSLSLKDSSSLKEKKISKSKDRTVSEIDKNATYSSQGKVSRKLCLNLSDEYINSMNKNVPVCIQDNQQYNQRSVKSFQNNTRCYTTNTIFGDSSESLLLNSSSVRNSHTASSLVPVKENHEFTQNSREILIKGSPKNLLKEKTSTVFSGNSSTFLIKPKLQKPANVSHSEEMKTDPIGNSNDLVKYLMKKVKIHRPVASKKKATSLVPINELNSNKSKFMQSATSSLVMNVLSKKENSLISLKTSQIEQRPRILTGNKLVRNELVPKPNFHTKALTLNNDNNVRGDPRSCIQKPNNNSKYSKYFLHEFNTTERDDIGSGKKFINSIKRSTESQYSEYKPSTIGNKEKLNKRLEVENMLSKLDTRVNEFSHQKTFKKSKEERKKVSHSKMDKKFKSEIKEAHSPRFHHQHELFKNQVRAIEENMKINPKQESPTTYKEATNESSHTSPFAELYINNKVFDLITNSSPQCELASLEKSTSTFPSIENEKNLKKKVLNTSNLNDSSVSNLGEGTLNDFSVNNISSNKLNLQPVEDKDIQCNTIPDVEHYHSEFENNNNSSTTPIQEKENSNKENSSFEYEESYILNENNWITPHYESNCQPKDVFGNTTEMNGTENTGQSTVKEDEKKQAKNRKKDKSNEEESNEATIDCGFEKIQKPGPNCEDNKQLKFINVEF